MIVIDTSAIMTIVLQEQDADRYADILSREPTSLMSSGTLLELDVVAYRRGRLAMQTRMEQILSVLGTIIMPLEGASLKYAREGYANFGIGRGEEPAALNFGDCFAYGLARAEDVPLLFKGDDFRKTDVKVQEIV